MRQTFTWLTTVNHPDEDMRRRGRNIAILAFGFICIGILLAPALSLINKDRIGPPAVIVSMVINFGVLLLARRGSVIAGSIIFISSMLAAFLLPPLMANSLSVTPFYLVLPIVVASLIMRPWHIWLVMLMSIGGLAVVELMLLDDLLRQEINQLILIHSTMILVIVTLTSFLGARSTSSALQSAQRAQAQSDASARALEQANANLEATVAERTAALQVALADLQAQVASQAELLAEVERQRTTIHELSVPVIPISASTLIMPLVGALDSERLFQVQEQALQSLQRTSAHFLILDITGVAVVDTQVAQGLLSVVQAARLLGAEVMLVGIRPEVAQAIVGLGLSLNMSTASDLQTALSQIARRQ